ncbi:MAG: serine/threonine-protein kinase [Candidatus Melainabacteria bacterium]|nr:serine/threonine-protein kinase [Candidatus Melainabacteria bacterium]
MTLDSQPQTTGLPKVKKCPACNEEYQDTNLVVCPKDRTMLLTPQKDELIGQILNDRYKVVEEVGRGGMSAVYKGIHELMDRTVAIKVLLPQLVSDTISIKRFQQEAQAASHLQHPNVITVYDYGFVASGQPYLVMDFLEGESLSDIIRHEKQCSTKRMIPIFMQACEALEHAHQKGVIHRDLKSSNIMLIDFEGKKDFVKVVDFGIAKLMPSSGKQSQNLTQTGEVFGSPIYMSPEQCMAQSLDARSDIYSMGAMMYESLTGQPPLMGNSIIDTMQMHMSTPPKPFREIRADLEIPEALERVVLKALAKKPEQRYQSMQELRDALEGVSKLLDKEKLFGPGPAAKGARSTRSSLAKYQQPANKTAGSSTSSQKATGRTQGATGAQMAPDPSASQTTLRKEEQPIKESLRTTRTQQRRKPEEVAETAKAKPNPLDKFKQLEFLKKVPLPALVAAAVIPFALVGVVVAFQSANIGKMFSTQQTVEGMVYFYNPSTSKKNGDISVYVANEEEDGPGKLVKIETPPAFNLDDKSGNTTGAEIGDYWKLTYHGQGDKKILDEAKWPAEQAQGGEDLKQINVLIRQMFGAMAVENDKLDGTAVASYYMPDWAADGYKKMNDTWSKETILFNTSGTTNPRRNYIKVESYDKDQGKATVLVRTKHWMKTGPQYMRFVMIKKDNRKWLIAKVEEIAPNIWESDGVTHEEAPEEEEEAAEE